MQRVLVGFAFGVVAVLLSAAPAMGSGSNGAFERAWGDDVLSGGGTGFEVCLVAAQCKTGVIGPLGGSLADPEEVAADASGNVYVTDQNHLRVEKFNSQGTFERAWGEDVINGGGTGFEVCVAGVDTCKSGSNNGAVLGGEMVTPSGIAVDNAGNVYVTDTGADRVDKYNSQGTFERAWGEDVINGGGTGFEVCVDPTDTCKAAAVTNPALGGEMDDPDSVAADSSGNVFVADRVYNRVQEFTSQGVFERAWGNDVINGGGTGFEVCAPSDTCQAGDTGPGGVQLAGVVANPEGIGVDGSGNVYVTTFARVNKFSSLGVFDRAWGKDVISNGVMNTGYEICVPANGDTCKAGVGGVDGTSGNMEDPFAVTVDGAGNVYVPNDTQHRVTKYNTQGVFERAWGKDVTAAGPGDTGTGFETCVAASGDTCQTGVAGTLGGEFNTPNGIAADPAGNVYVADRLNNRIEKFAAVPSAPPAPRNCGDIVGSDADNFHPKVRKKNTVLGVRAVFAVSEPSDLSIVAAARINGKRVALGTHALSDVFKQAKLRIPLPKKLAKHLEKGDKAILYLDVTTRPKSSQNCGTTTKKLKLKTKVINVIATLVK